MAALIGMSSLACGTQCGSVRACVAPRSAAADTPVSTPSRADAGTPRVSRRARPIIARRACAACGTMMQPPMMSPCVAGLSGE